MQLLCSFLGTKFNLNHLSFHIRGLVYNTCFLLLQLLPMPNFPTRTIQDSFTLVLKSDDRLPYYCL